MSDAVNHPAHYTTGKIEVIDFIEDQKLGFHEANAVKYIARAKHKGQELEDLRKGRWYLDRRIRELGGGQAPVVGLEDAIASLFINGNGSEADRLVLVDDRCKDLGGWCKQAAIDHVKAYLAKSP